MTHPYGQAIKLTVKSIRGRPAVLQKNLNQKPEIVKPSVKEVNNRIISLRKFVNDPSFDRLKNKVYDKSAGIIGA